MGKFNMLKSAYTATVSAVSKTVRKSFKGACAVTVSALLVMQGLVPSVAVIADEIDSSDETEAVYEVVASPAAAEADDVVIEVGETEETVDENVDSVPADDTAESEDPADVDTNPPIEDQSEVTEVTETEATETTETETVETSATETVESDEAEVSETDEVVESSVETTEPQAYANISLAEDADAFADAVSNLSSDMRLVVETENDISDCVTDVNGVYYNGVYILSFDSSEAYDQAISYFDANGIAYAIDASVGLCDDLQSDDDENGYSGPSSFSGGYAPQINPNATVRVAVIDTGSDLANEAYSVIGDDVADDNGHGTSVVTSLLEESNDVYVISIKAVGSSGQGSMSDICAAVQLANDLDVDYILMALSIKDNGDYDAFKSLVSGTSATVVAAAGNNGSNASGYLPAGIDGVITVGAIADNAEVKSFSNYGDCVEYYVYDASSTSEASARALGRIIDGRVESSVSTVAYLPSEGAYTFVEGSSDYFSLNAFDAVVRDPAYLIALTPGDMNGYSASQFYGRVLDYGNSYLGTRFGVDGEGDCISFAMSAWLYASDHSGNPWTSGMGYNFYSQHAFTTCTAFMSSGGYPAGSPVGIMGVSTKSSDAVAIPSYNAVKDYLETYAEPGDMLLMGNGSKWVHAAIYVGIDTSHNMDPDSSHYQYGGSTWDGIMVYQDSEGSTTGVQLRAWSPAYFNRSGTSKQWTQLVILKPSQAPDDVPLGLYKVPSSGYDCVTNGNSCYDFAGTVYTLYSDAACTNVLHTYTFNSEGHTVGDIFVLSGSEVLNEPTYYLKETTAGPGYQLDPTVYSVTFHSDRTISVSSGATVSHQSASASDPAEITLSDTPLLDNFFIKLQKVNDVNLTATQATMDSATFRVCYYAADYGITDTLGTPTDNFEITISNPSTLATLNLQALTVGSSRISVSGDNDYLLGVYNGFNGVETHLPLGTYTVQEITPPTGFEVNSTLYRIRIYESGDDTAQTIRNMTTGANIPVIVSGQTATAEFTSIHEPHTYAYYSLIKDLPDTAINNNRAGFEYNMYWKKSDGTYVLFATGTSQSDGRVYWTYQIANYYHLDETDYETKTLLTGTRTYTLEVVAGETYEVRETIKDLPYGNQNSGLTYTSITPSGWTRGNGYFYKTVTVAAGTTAADSAQYVSNDWNYGSLTVRKTKPTNDLFDITKVDFTLYTYVNNVRKVVATGTVDSNGNITWTRVDTNGYGVYQSGNYDRRTSVNTIANLPLGTYYVEETWDKVYIDTLDAATLEAIEVFATNNSANWTTNADGTRYVSTIPARVTTDGVMINLGAAENDLHYQWFGANKTVTVAGDASTVQFELYYTSGDTPVLFATGYAETDGIGTYPIIWDGYNGPSNYIRNGKQEIVLPEGNYEIREIVPETYYQNGRDNVPYSYMVPSGWQNHVGTNGHSDYFFKTFTAVNNANTVISSVNPTNVRIEAELTVRKIEQTNAPEREFTFEIYYRGNEAEPMNVGVFTDEYLLDTITVTTVDGSGYATLDKIPEGWYEVIEVDNDGWEAIWMNSATNTASGKLVHASSENLTKSNIVVNDNIKLFGVAFSGILINNMISPTVEIPKIDSWTTDVVASDITHPEGVHLTFYLYEDRDGDGALSDLELSYGYVARIDGDDDGSVKFENLRAGKYIVHEVATIDGYYLTAADTAFELSEPELTVIEMGNMPYTETVKVTKVDNETDELLSGAVFTVFVDTNDNGEYDAEDQIAQMWNDANGNQIVDDGELMDAVLVETSKGVYESYALHFNDGRTFGNRYFLVETEAPENYFFVNEDGTFSDTSRVVTFTVDKKDTTAADFQVGINEFTFRNQTGEVFAKKTNQDGEFLSGAEFTVYSDEACSQVVGVLTENTAEETYSYRGLGLGTYYLKETKAPTGFEIDPNTYEFEVTLDQVHPVVMNFMAYKYNVDGAFVDVEIHTTANDPKIANPDDSYSIIARESEETTIVDRVYFDGLIIGNEYQVTGDLVYQADFDGHKAGDVITTQTVTFVAGDEGDEAQSFTINEDGKTIEGYIDVVFTVNTTKITTTIVAFETIKTLPEGTVVGVHASLNDVPQTKVIPHIGTTIADQQTMINQTSLGGTVTVVDEVAYENLIKGETYTLNGVLVDSETGDEVATGTVQFTADGDIVKTVVVDGQVIDLVSGTANVTFELDVTDLGGRSFVAFEYLFMTGVDGTDVQIASHEDLDDEGQTIHVPEIRTHANVPEKDLRLAPAIEDYTFTDTVMYENLIPGKTYTVTGVLMNADTGETLLDEDGNLITGSKEFTPSAADGSVDVEFTVNTLWLQGKTVVVFEDLYYEGVRIATHSDIEDKDQTFDIPEVHTTATTALGNTVEYSTQAVITDHVYYSNLIVGKTYEVTGTLVVKGTGDSVRDANGEIVIAMAAFTPEASEGFVDVTFVFDATLYQGQTIVAFETLTYEGVTYAVHADIEDEDQTVYVPEIHTTATDANGNKVFQATESATIVDEIAYTNLEPGKTYRADGVLMDKSTGAPLLIDGQEVRASVTFTPEAANGTVTVTFTFNASALAGKSLVVFENVYDVSGAFVVNPETGEETFDTTIETLVATHEDIDDEGQTVTITDVPKTGESGEYDHFVTAALVAGGVAAAAGAAFVALKKNKKKEQGGEA